MPKGDKLDFALNEILNIEYDIKKFIQDRKNDVKNRFSSMLVGKRVRYRYFEDEFGRITGVSFVFTSDYLIPTLSVSWDSGKVSENLDMSGVELVK